MKLIVPVISTKERISDRQTDQRFKEELQLTVTHKRTPCSSSIIAAAAAGASPSATAASNERTALICDSIHPIIPPFQVSIALTWDHHCHSWEEEGDQIRSMNHGSKPAAAVLCW